MSETAIKAVTQNLCFGGVQSVYTHASQETQCAMRFGVFLPPQAASGRVPVLYWLSGLTCTEENFIVKAGAQRVAAALGLAIVVPDTSPRGLGIPGEGDSYDFGLGAGFYVDATALLEDRGWTGPPLLVDQGTKDQFLQSQLKPELLQDACQRSGVSLDLRLREGYDHSYFFIASFIEDHLRFHARNL